MKEKYVKIISNIIAINSILVLGFLVMFIVTKYIKIGLIGFILTLLTTFYLIYLIREEVPVRKMR